MLLQKGRLRAVDGVSLTLLVVLMPLLMGVVGIVIDTGFYGLALVQLSSAADSAALAAASAVDIDHYAETDEIRLNPTIAQERAKAFATANYDGNVETTVTIDPANPARVTVQLKATRPTIFLKLFGKNEVTLEARSDAKVE